MSHEIYYTSAPEGLKRGTSGFSTVAASDNIPKPLWDRLETLSAYRHHFGVEGGGVGGVNPISEAHWILTVAGKTHHVLSRICDSGVDHTQRTNAFAHHLVLDAGEMEGAAGGPAWLLGQGGVMAAQWDGRVGNLAPHGLPRGGDASRVCRAWGGVTGDAGWGGHLADLFTKSPHGARSASFFHPARICCRCWRNPSRCSPPRRAGTSPSTPTSPACPPAPLVSGVAVWPARQPPKSVSAMPPMA